MYYLGVDLGTSSLKVLLCDGGGHIVDTAKADYECSYPYTGWSEQNPEDWWIAFKKVLADLKSRRDISGIKAISFCGHMHGLVILDKDDKVVRPCLLWNDSRSVNETKFINDKFGDRLLEMTGNVAFVGFTAPKLLWVKNNEPENFKKISKVMLPKDYLLYKCSGVFASDVSDNSGTLYFDVKNKTWQKDMLDILGIDQNKLPKIFESYDVIGTVTKELASETGLSLDTKIVAGGGDQAVGAVGTGTVGAGRLNISLGTSGVIFASGEKYSPSVCTGLHNFAHADGKWHFMGCTLACAASVDFWIKDILSLSDYGSVLDQCSKADLSDIIFLPYLSGERSPINDPNATGTLSGLRVHHTKIDIIKAVVESICFALKDCLKEMQNMGATPKVATAIGGLTQSKWVLQLLATILDLDIQTLNTTDGGAYGASILAMVGDGKYSSVAEACNKLISYQPAIEPDKSLTEKYNEKFLKYKELYNSIHNAQCTIHN